MTRYPNRTRAAMATALFMSASLLASCSGLSSFIPKNSGTGGTPNIPTAPPSGAPTTNPTATPTMAPTSTPTPRPQQACNIPTAPIPGTYTSMLMVGNLSGSTVTLDANFPSTWTRNSYVAATPTPVPTISPTTAPTPTPPPGQPLYAYYGTYTVTHNGTTEPMGCMILITTQNGAPITNQTFNTALSGSPNVQGPYTTTLLGTGSVTALSLTNLGANGGSGTFSLSDGSTGTLSLTSRVSVADATKMLKLHL